MERSRLVVCCVVALAASGCTVSRFVGIALQHGREPLRQTPVVEQPAASCVVLFLPGLGDAPQRFEEHGFVEVMERHGSCDASVVDSHFGYYRDANLVPRLIAVLEPLRAPPLHGGRAPVGVAR